MAKHVDLLLVEDNPGDAELVKDCVETLDLPVCVHVVSDGAKALEFLSRERTFAEAPRPNMIFLDLNLPKKDGREVLSTIKSDPDLQNIPVIVMTSSEAPRDVAAAYDLHANCYITKPGTYSGFLQTIRSIGDFWLGTARLP